MQEVFGFPPSVGKAEVVKPWPCRRCCCRTGRCVNPQEVGVEQRLIFRASYRLVVEHLLSTSVAVDSIPSTVEILKNTYIHI